MLTQERLKEVLTYDKNTGHFTWLVALSNRTTVGTRAGNTSPKGYRRVMIDNITVMEHRLVWLYVFGVLPNNDLDHINHQRDDNRLCNLREATRKENMQNMLMRKRQNTSGFTCVSLHRKTGKWRAYIVVDYKQKHLGLFDTPEEAHEAYLKAKAQYHHFQPTLN